MSTSPWDTITVLADPVRRALYQHVRRQHHPVTREEAAQAVAISRNLTAFHLDKLVDAGLLRARYESPPDRQRGRGRTPKVYEATGPGLSLTDPPRRYDLIGEILADAVAAEPTDAAAAAHRHADALGRRVGDNAQALPTLLADLGFEPRAAGPDLLLDNCPFHALAQRHPELICGINHAFVAGLLDGLGVANLRAELYPRPGHCCVRLSPAG